MSWPRQKLQALAADVPYSFVGGPFGSKLTSRDYVGEGVPVIRGSNLNNGRFLGMEDFVFVSDSKVREDLSSNLAAPGDLVFTQRGTLGQVAIIPEDGIFNRYVISQSQMKLTVDDTRADRLFLYYYFSSREAVQRIISFTASSGVPHINLTVLRNFELPVPPLSAQQAIASNLSTYDDLIENNRRRIELLEQAARLLYKEWFVHLRFPGHEHVTSTDGVPEGWERRPLGNCAEFLSGGTPSKSKADFWNGDVPWVSSGELTTMRLHRTKLNITHDAIKAGSRIVAPDTILGVVRGMSLAKEFRVGITARPLAFNQDLKALVSKPDVDALYLFHAIDAQRNAIRDSAGDASHGTKKLPTPVLASVQILVPTPALQAVFQQFARALHSQWDVLDSENQRLQDARDLLLPRLMNGEIPV